jgi:predicted 3-demethylubiquinone-9 3-methyltransferase (glyoxalase superfamily)
VEKEPAEGNRNDCTFELDGQEFMALNGGPHFKFTEAISLMVNCETAEDCPVVVGEVPPQKGGRKTIAICNAER